MIDPEQRPQAIRERLTAAFDPDHLAIADDSHRHAGHASAKGGGHFTVTIVAEAFAGKGPLERHRMVHDAVSDLMADGTIHALSIRASAPAEV